MSDQAETTGEGFWVDGEGMRPFHRCRALLDTVSDGLCELDADGRFVAVDDGFVELTGYSRDGLLGEHVSVLLADPDVDRIDGAIRDRFETDAGENPTDEITIETASGDRIPCELQIDRHTDGDEFDAIGCVVRDISERRERERELATYETLFEESKDVNVVVEPDGTFRYLTPSAETVFGYDPEELVGEVGFDYIHPDDREEAMREFTKLIETAGYEPTVEFRFERKDGSWIVLEAHGRDLRDDPDIEGIVVYTRDVTERKARERELTESERRYRTIVENFPDGAIGLFDDDLRYTAVGGQLLDQVGLSPEDRVGKRITDVYPDEIVAEYEQYFHAALDGEMNSFEAELHDRYLYTHTLPVRNADDQVFAGMLMAQDISERKERERELEQYETIIESLDEGVYVVDADRNFQWVNEAYAEMLGYTPDELIGENATMIVDDEVIREAEAVEEEQGYEHLPRMDVELVTADGDRIPVDAASTVLPGGEKDGWFRAGIVRDITERKEYERRLEGLVDELEESNERLKQFAYAASHDLQEPLRMVSSYLQLIERRYGDRLDEDGVEFLEFAVDGADRMREMVQGLLEYSRVETRGDSFEPVDLDVVLEAVIEDLHLQFEESDAKISTEALPTVTGDANQLRQVFQNLLSNAIEYSGDEPPRVHVSAEREGSAWRISVSDEGVGIDPQDADRIFEVFQRLHGPTEHDGTGIGLALCDRIVERHGGDIWVESEPGEGATFRFTLPVARGHDS